MADWKIFEAQDLVPGDVVTGSGVGFTETVTRVRVEENDAPGQQDRLMITFNVDSCSVTGLVGNTREERCTLGRKFTVRT